MPEQNGQHRTARAPKQSARSALAVPILGSIVPEKDTESNAWVHSGRLWSPRRFNSQRAEPSLPGEAGQFRKNAYDSTRCLLRYCPLVNDESLIMQ